MEGHHHRLGAILRGYQPSLSIEITRECPLRCPGCYAYGDDHLGGDVTLRQVTDYKGQELVDRVLGDRRRGKAPSRFDRRRRAARPLPRAPTDPAALAERGIYTQLVTSAVRADSRSSGPASRGCRSSSRSTGCSRSTTRGARRPPTIAS